MGLRYRPYAFTEQGVAMLSSVLQSDRAVEVNIAIMRAFVRLREILSTHKDLARKLEELEKKYDENFRVVFKAIRQLMTPPASPQEGPHRISRNLVFSCRLSVVGKARSHERRLPKVGGVAEGHRLCYRGLSSDAIISKRGKSRSDITDTSGIGLNFEQCWHNCTRLPGCSMVF